MVDYSSVKTNVPHFIWPLLGGLRLLWTRQVSFPCVISSVIGKLHINCLKRWIIAWFEYIPRKCLFNLGDCLADVELMIFRVLATLIGDNWQVIFWDSQTFVHIAAIQGWTQPRLHSRAGLTIATVQRECEHSEGFNCGVYYDSSSTSCTLFLCSGPIFGHENFSQTFFVCHGSSLISAMWVNLLAVFVIWLIGSASFEEILY